MSFNDLKREMPTNVLISYKTTSNKVDFNLNQISSFSDNILT